jgi:hypothetical protein
VEVKSEYTYLGTITPTDGLSWKAQVDLAITKAKRRSSDLLWICRGDKGIRPRTAVSIWQALVRPLLEYASELWEGTIPADQERAAEAVQMTFLRGTLGLHANGSGIANEVVRAETGCERLCDRRAKLKLGYWRKLFTARPDRLLTKVANFRWRECVNDGAFGNRGFMPTAKTAFARVGMLDYWQQPDRVENLSHGAWKEEVDEAVNTTSDRERAERMLTLPSASTYLSIKEWGVNPKEYAFSQGEVGRLGQHVPERYLDDRCDLKGTRLKLLCRTGSLPVLDRVGRESQPARWPAALRTCMACNTGEVEDVSHFMMACPLFSAARDRMLAETRKALSRSLGPLGTREFDALPREGKLVVLLGRRVEDKAVEDRIDRTVKVYLKKAWNARDSIRITINNKLGTNYGVFNSDR